MMLGHHLVNVVVIAVLDARADPSGPRGPETVADPALAEGRHTRGRSVGGISGVQSVREIVVLDFDRVAAGGYPREKILVPTHQGEGGIVLDPAQHVRYTSGVHRGSLPVVRASGCYQHRRGHFLFRVLDGPPGE